MHEALLWMGYVTGDEVERSEWSAWLDELRAGGRASREIEADGVARWRATEASHDPVVVMRGRMEALGPVVLASDARPAGDAIALPVVPADAAEPLLALEAQGVVLRCRIGGQSAWCDRRLLARIHRSTIDRLRREIEPVTANEFWRFLACWQHADPAFRLEGPRGVHEVVRKLAGFEIPAAEWEPAILRSRVRDLHPEWLDQLTLTGEVVWGRVWGAGDSPIRSTPICLLPREDLEAWMSLSALRAPATPAITLAPGAESGGPLSTYARTILDALDQRGASFAQELERATRLLPSHFEMGLTQLIGHGLVTCDSFGGLRRLITPPSRRRGVMKHTPLMPAGRWSRFRDDVVTVDGATGAAATEEQAGFVARQFLTRYGVVFRRLLERERIPIPWRDLVRVYRHQELRGDVRGGRFVQRFAGEQYALPEAVELMRRLRRIGGSPRVHALDKMAGADTSRQHHDAEQRPHIEVAATDPLNLQGVLTPDAKIPAQTRKRVSVA
jgi:ATP-dependent Lhr-like helicase